MPSQVSFIYVAQYHKFAAYITTPYVLKPSIKMKKNSPIKIFNRNKMEETSGRVTKEGSLSERTRPLVFLYFSDRVVLGFLFKKGKVTQRFGA